MAETKKMTKKDYLNVIRGIVADRPELVTFIDHEVELLNRKNSSKGQTKTQKENELLMNDIVSELERISTPVTISEFQKQSAKFSDFTNQKLSALFKKLVDNNTIVKTVDKKKSYFSLAD